MISDVTPVFPNNVVNLVAPRLQALDSDIKVLKRPLRNTDPQQSIGVFAQLWTPDEESEEIMGRTPAEPTAQQYILTVQAFIRDGDPERGLAVHSVLSALVRRVLYRDNTLRVALQGLSVTDSGGITEILKRWKVRSQRYFNNDIDGQWLYLSTLEFWMETEIIQ